VDSCSVRACARYVADPKETTDDED